jgi:hypothetical protein
LPLAEDVDVDIVDGSSDMSSDALVPGLGRVGGQAVVGFLSELGNGLSQPAPERAHILRFASVGTHLQP